MNKGTEKNVVMTTQVNICETLMSIPIGENYDFSVYDIALENARTLASYLKKRGRGEFKITRTSPVTFNVRRIK